MKILDDQFVKNFRVLFKDVIFKLVYYISWDKKIARPEYWATWLGSIAIFIGILLAYDQFNGTPVPSWLIIPLAIYCFLVQIAARISRLKDTGLSLWHLLWVFGLQILGSIILGMLASEKKSLVKIVTQPSSTTTSATDESIVGLKKNLSNEDAIRFIKKEYRKWNGRLNSLKPGNERDNAQRLLDTLARLRTKYEK